MKDFTTAHGPVPRTLFLAGHAECQTCRAHVRPTAETRAIVRAAAAPTAVAWCSVCCSTSVYDFESPSRAL